MFYDYVFVLENYRKYRFCIHDMMEMFYTNDNSVVKCIYIRYYNITTISMIQLPFYSREKNDILLLYTLLWFMKRLYIDIKLM